MQAVRLDRVPPQLLYIFTAMVCQAVDEVGLGQEHHNGGSGAARVAMRQRGCRLCPTQPTARRTGFPTRVSISTSVSMVNLDVLRFTTSETRGRETIKIWAACACFR